MKKLLPFVLALFASAAFAGDCHIAVVTPIVNAWGIAGNPGGLVVDAKIAARVPGLPPHRNYDDSNSDDGWWWHYLYLRPEGETGFYKQISCSSADVTDSTFRFDGSWPAGIYEYVAFVGGTNGDPQECAFAYEFRGTVTIVDDPTSARRASWGALRARWAR